MSRLLGKNQECLLRRFYRRAKNKVVETLFFSKTRHGLDKFHRALADSFKPARKGAYGKLSERSG
ncbi:hypothetical protein [Snuella sedimenti]|uniref:Uncharacterized protein n=1 Tax=Snuella sedimenti TaxID=2798802 RepID=A0A8J7J5Z8_9FLAO|nr:hypothetical protein [Snuella sedimenti]MBJ6369149.1 hypothetical protein [Snuella sedimenti]